MMANDPPPAWVREPLREDRWTGRGVVHLLGLWGGLSTADTPRPTVCRMQAHVQGQAVRGLILQSPRREFCCSLSPTAGVCWGPLVSLGL